MPSQPPCTGEGGEEARASSPGDDCTAAGATNDVTATCFVLMLMTVSFFASPGSIDAMKLFMMLGIERTAESVCGQQRGCWVVNTMVDGWSIVCDSVR